MFQSVHRKLDISTNLSPDVTLGEAVPCLGNFIEFSWTDPENDPQEDDSTGDSTKKKKTFFKILMAAANKASHLPEKKSPVNQKAKLFNDIISWLQQQRVRFMSTNVTSLRNQLINYLAMI